VIRRRGIVALTLLAAVVAGGCSTLLTADPTPVPGAAATLTRSLRTPIPTTVQSPGPGGSPSPARPGTSASPGPSPVAAAAGVDETEIAQLQQRLAQITSSPSLPNVEGLLLDHVSLSTPQGGSVLSSADTASWLRDHAGAGIKLNSVGRGTQSLMLQVSSDGWPVKDPIQQGMVTFSLRKYDSNGRPNDDAGDWKIDVIDAE
jgi:hypothetical protein